MHPSPPSSEALSQGLIIAMLMMLTAVAHPYAENSSHGTIWQIRKGRRSSLFDPVLP